MFFIVNSVGSPLQTHLLKRRVRQMLYSSEEDTRTSEVEDTLCDYSPQICSSTGFSPNVQSPQNSREESTEVDRVKPVGSISTQNETIIHMTHHDTSPWETDEDQERDTSPPPPIQEGAA